MTNGPRLAVRLGIHARAGSPSAVAIGLLPKSGGLAIVLHLLGGGLAQVAGPADEKESIRSASPEAGMLEFVECRKVVAVRVKVLRVSGRHRSVRALAVTPHQGSCEDSERPITQVVDANAPQPFGREACVDHFATRASESGLDAEDPE